MAKYIYNKTVLEEIPENYITKYFPYRILLEYASWQDDGMASPYTLMLSDQPFMVESQAEMGLVVGAQIGSGAHLAMGEYNLETEEYAIYDLAEPTEDMVLPLEIGIFTLLWTSHDVMNITDNTVYMAGTEPVPYVGKKYRIGEDTLANIANAIRNKTLSEDELTPVEMAEQIANIQTKLNIAFGDTEPSDNNVLWLKTTEGFVDVSNKYESTTLNEEWTRANGIVKESMGGICVGDKIYYFGGGDTKIHTVDIKTTETTTLNAVLPYPLENMGVANVGSKIYIFGGNHGSNYDVVDQILMFDTDTNTLTTLSATLQQPMTQMGVAVCGKKIYILGGEGKSYSYDTVQVFDTETNTIEVLSTTLPAPRSNMGCEVVGNKIYLFGGLNMQKSDVETYFKNVVVFDITTKTFETTGDILNTNLVKAVRYNDKVCLLSYSTVEYNEYYGIYLFDPETNVVTRTEFENYKFVSPTVVSHKDEIYYTLVRTSKIYKLGEAILVNAGAIKVLYSTKSTYQIVGTDKYNIDLGIRAAYKGNSNGIGKQVDAYLYNNETGLWELVVDIPEVEANLDFCILA